MEKIELLSLIVPAYKQGKKIVKNIHQLRTALVRQNIPFEIIVVVDGRIDKTYEHATKLRSKRVRVLGYKKNVGKGNAIRYGAERAKGDVIGFMDAGMEIDPAGISMLLSHMIWYDADIIVGSKLHPVSRVEYPFIRKVMSWGYRTLTRILFGFKVRDTQVGLKLYKREVVLKVFPYLLVKRFAFDIEVLAVAYSFGFKRIYEAPIKLNFDKVGTTIKSNSFWKAIGNMLLDTAAVFYRLKLAKYYHKKRREKK